MHSSARAVGMNRQNAEALSLVSVRRIATEGRAAAELRRVWRLSRKNYL